jgi:protease I
VRIVSLKERSIRGWDESDWGDSIEVDDTIDAASPQDFDGLLVPGGQMNPDFLRADPRAVRFVRDMYDAKKPIAAICHGPWVLIEAGIVKGLHATSYNSIRTDMLNAGADWVDEAVVVDDGIVTSRKPADLPAFCAKMIEEFTEGRHPQRRVA